MINTKYHDYKIFYKGEFLEMVKATNKKNALTFYGDTLDNRLKKDFTAEKINQEQ